MDQKVADHPLKIARSGYETSRLAAQDASSMRHLKAFIWMFYGLMAWMLLLLLMFSVFLLFFCVFSKKVSSNSRGVVHTVKQKLRQPFLP